MKLLLFAFLIALSLPSICQVNIDSVAHIDVNSLHDCGLNDIWGYVDETGVEYALVGTTLGTSVVSLATPTNPTEVFWELGTESVWRDLKTWEDYAYVTTEANDGLLIVDLSPLPSNTSLNTNYYFGETGSMWSSAHNLYIDSNGYAYIFGANRGNGGVIILDVHTDPMNPVEVGSFDDWYVHDGYVRNDTMFLAHIFDGFLSIVDITDKTNPVVLGVKNTSSNFAHNIWPSDDGKYVFTTDEISGAFLDSYDVSDPSNPIELDRIQSSPGKGVVPHNTHFLNDYIITSYYSDGIKVHDVKQKDNLIEVGSYDTHPEQTTGYEGCWGAYPYLPSGYILATDRSEGLFILNPNYQRASYLRGVTTNSSNNDLLEGVSVVITNDVQVNTSNSIGEYATGVIGQGSYEVTYSKVGFYPQTFNLNLSQGATVTQDVALVPMPPYMFKIVVLEEGTNTPVSDAKITLNCSLMNHSGITNGIGEEDLILFYEEGYSLTVGKWGFVTVCQDLLIDQTSGSVTVHLKTGYYDDFSLDFGWTVEGDAETGIWERGTLDSTTNYAPPIDADYDCGKFAFVTGNASNQDSDFDDVDNGTTRLRSPIFDLSGYSTPYIHYSRWFFNYYGPEEFDDTLRVMLSNGTDVVEVDKVGGSALENLLWVNQAVFVSDYILPTNTMQFIVEVADTGANINITEAGLDYFFIAEQNQLSLEEKEEVKSIQLFPNPVLNHLNVQGAGKEERFEIFNAQGALLLSGKLNQAGIVNVNSLSSGMYFIKIGSYQNRFIKE